jgi:hypothetical protein
MSAVEVGTPVSETPLAWFHVAHAYLHTAAVLNAAPKPKGGFYESPVRFLYFHAIELFLKAFLRLKGMEDAELANRAFSHQLAILPDEAERQGLLIGKRVRLVCDAARDFDKPLQTRYIKTGAKSELPTTRLHEAARDLQGRVAQALRSSGIATRQLPALPVVHPPRPLTVAKAAKIIARKM